MKVKELREALSNYPDDMEVLTKKDGNMWKCCLCQ